MSEANEEREWRFPELQIHGEIIWPSKNKILKLGNVTRQCGSPRCTRDKRKQVVTTPSDELLGPHCGFASIGYEINIPIPINGALLSSTEKNGILPRLTSDPHWSQQNFYICESSIIRPIASPRLSISFRWLTHSPIHSAQPDFIVA